MIGSQRPFDQEVAGTTWGCLRPSVVALPRLGQVEEAGAWGSRIVRQPGAHFGNLRIAVICMMAASRDDEVVPLVRRINSESPENGGEPFIRTLRLKPADERVFRDLSRQSGLR